MTYLLLGVPFLAVAAGVWVVARRAAPVPRAAVVALAFAGVALLTAVFDNAIIAAGVVGYAEHRTLGLRLGLAPLEDWLYPAAGVMLLPALWELLGRRRSGSTS